MVRSKKSAVIASPDERLPRYVKCLVGLAVGLDFRKLVSFFQSINKAFLMLGENEKLKLLFTHKVEIFFYRLFTAEEEIDFVDKRCTALRLFVHCFYRALRDILPKTESSKPEFSEDFGLQTDNFRTVMEDLGLESNNGKRDLPPTSVIDEFWNESHDKYITKDRPRFIYEHMETRITAAGFPFKTRYSKSFSWTEIKQKNTQLENYLSINDDKPSSSNHGANDEISSTPSSSKSNRSETKTDEAHSNTTERTSDSKVQKPNYQRDKDLPKKTEGCKRKADNGKHLAANENCKKLKRSETKEVDEVRTESSAQDTPNFLSETTRTSDEGIKAAPVSKISAHKYMQERKNMVNDFFNEIGRLQKFLLDKKFEPFVISLEMIASNLKTISSLYSSFHVSIKVMDEKFSFGESIKKYRNGWKSVAKNCISVETMLLCINHQLGRLQKRLPLSDSLGANIYLDINRKLQKSEFVRQCGPIMQEARSDMIKALQIVSSWALKVKKSPRMPYLLYIPVNSSVPTYLNFLHQFLSFLHETIKATANLTQPEPDVYQTLLASIDEIISLV